MFVVRDHLLGRRRGPARRPELRFELCPACSTASTPDDAGRELHAVPPAAVDHPQPRVRLRKSAPPIPTRIPSLPPDYPTNDWHERETYDMFGIIFDGHPR